jgi:predicted transcriptional regulator
VTKKRLMLIPAGALVALLLTGLFGVSVASAQELVSDPEPPVPPMPFDGPGGLGRCLLGRVGGDLWTMFDAAAEALGLTPEEFFADLHTGKSLREIAKEQGVEMEDVREAMRATRQAGHSPWATYDTVAEALGLTPDELFAELHEGKTLSEIAEEQGVEMDEVREAVSAAQVEAQKAAIEQAVEDGRLTEEQADWMLEGLEKGFLPARRGLGGQRFDRGGGTGMRRPEVGQGQGMHFGFDL